MTKTDNVGAKAKVTVAGTCVECQDGFVRTVSALVLKRWQGKIMYCSQRCAQTAWQRADRARRGGRPVKVLTPQSERDDPLHRPIHCECGERLHCSSDPMTGVTTDYCPKCGPQRVPVRGMRRHDQRERFEANLTEKVASAENAELKPVNVRRVHQRIVVGKRAA